MKKWSVRLIGFYFFIWAAVDIYGLITGTRHAKGFMGIDLGLTYNGELIDVMAWIGAYVLAYTGYHLLKLNSQGRNWALVVFWPSVIVTGFYLLSAIVSSASSSRFGINSSISLYLLKSQWTIDGAVLPLVFGGFFFLNLISLYFLMRKDIRNLFLKPDEVTEKIS